MLGVNGNSSCTFHIRWIDRVKFQGQLKHPSSKDRLKRPISQLLEVGFKKLFDSHM